MTNAVEKFMKNIEWGGIIATVSLSLLTACAQAPVPSYPNAAYPNPPAQTGAAGAVPADISPSAAEVIRLAESGVGDEVVVAYIQNSQASFYLSADHVLYLKDLGLSPQVLSAMLSHDSVMRSQAQSYPSPTQPSVAPPPPQTEVPPQAVEAPLA